MSLTAREIFPRNSVIFESSRNLRKLPPLLGKFVDKAADSMTALATVLGPVQTSNFTSAELIPILVDQNS